MTHSNHRIRRALTVSVIAALLGVAGPLAPASAQPTDAAPHATVGGCWNKPVLPDWCQVAP